MRERIKALAERWVTKHLPVFAKGHSAATISVCSRYGAYHMTNDLFDMGHRRIGFVGATLAEVVIRGSVRRLNK